MTAARARTPPSPSGTEQFADSQLAHLPGMTTLDCADLLRAIPPERADAVRFRHSNGIHQQRGTLCAQVVDVEGCEDAVGQADLDHPFMWGTSVVVRRGETAEVLRPWDRDRLIEVVGPVDSPERAAAVTSFHPSGPWCGPHVRLREHEGAYEAVTWQSGDLCGYHGKVRHWILDPDGQPRLATSEPTGGRSVPCNYGPEVRATEGRPAQTLTGAPVARDVGSRLARMAYHEAASVLAFEELAARLDGWGAPRELVAGCRLAAQQERRHAELADAAAARFGARVPAPSATRDRSPTLLALAIENAQDGCANETYSALVAAHQARHAQMASVRGLMEEVARDELDHAALAHALDRWMRSRLARPARAQVERARIDYLADLGRRSERARARPFDGALGIPAPAIQRWLIERVAVVLPEGAAERS